MSAYFFSAPLPIDRQRFRNIIFVVFLLGFEEKKGMLPVVF